MDLSKSLQDQFSPQGICFGCGPANHDGLQIKSFVKGDKVLCTWHPKPFHQAFPGMLNGGIIGSLLDCHCNWTAAYALMQASESESPPCTVTAQYTIKLLEPTPSGLDVQLEAEVVEVKGRKASIRGTLSSGGKVTASCEGIFVAVQPGHPAYHRW